MIQKDKISIFLLPAGKDKLLQRRITTTPALIALFCNPLTPLHIF